MKPIASLDIHTDLSLTEKAILEQHGCHLSVLVRDSIEQPLWHIAFPPGTCVESTDPCAGRLIDSLIILPTGLVLTWLQNKQGDRVWNTCRIPSIPHRIQPFH